MRILFITYILFYSNFNYSQKLIISSEFNYSDTRIDSLNHQLTQKNKTGINSKLHYQLGMAYGYKQEIIRSTQHFLFCANDTNVYNTEYQAISNLMLTYIYTVTGKIEDRNKYLSIIAKNYTKIKNDSTYYSSLSYVAGYYSTVKHDLDSAILFRKEIINEGVKYIDSTTLQSTYFNLASNYTTLRNFDSAFVMLTKGLEIDPINKLNPNGINRQQMFGLHLLSNNYLQRNNKVMAIEYARLFSESALQQNDTLYVYHSYDNLSMIFSKINQFDSAYHYKYKALKMYKTYVNTDKQKALDKVNIQVKYEYDKKLDSLRNDKIIQEKNSELSNEKQINTIIKRTLLIGLIILIGLTLLLYYLYKSRKLISKQKKQLSKHLKQNDLLLNEAHHRVKNNLQVISSLLDKQAGLTENEEVKMIMKSGQNRIQSMALLHQYLNNEKSFYSIGFETYAKELCKLIFDSYFDQSKNLKLIIDVQEHKLEVNTTISLGFILNELLSNALLHAFKNRTFGSITIVLRKIDTNLFKLTVVDDGIGKQTKVDPLKRSLGLELVDGLAWQLNGSVITKSSSENGTKIEVSFKNK